MKKKHYYILLLIISTFLCHLSYAQVDSLAIFRPNIKEYKEAYFPFVKRPVYENNKIRFTVAKKQDSFAKIALETNLDEYDLRKYNDITDWKYEPVEGEIIYLQVKSKKSSVHFHTIIEGESLRGISQRYAVQLKVIFNKNIKLGVPLHQLQPGDKICISCK